MIEGLIGDEAFVISYRMAEGGRKHNRPAMKGENVGRGN
jgi:hypothetical protein